MTRKEDDYLGDDRATKCGAYIKHRMPELTDAQARDAATMALSWIGDNPLWRKQDDADLIDDRIETLEAEVERLRENTEAGRLLEWISYHPLPLQLWREDDGQWVVVDGSTNHVLGSGEDAETAIRAALSADTPLEAP